MYIILKIHFQIYLILDKNSKLKAAYFVHFAEKIGAAQVRGGASKP